jgi:hypothetical protein
MKERPLLLVLAIVVIAGLAWACGVHPSSSDWLISL